ncbi:MAG: DUF3048 domain-containing protein [Candidatus Eremiobacter antarcticus]|nr:DUF3048 domain-containing protein [Candidatus Eremiobacteraeota bacterium]
MAATRRCGDAFAGHALRFIAVLAFAAAITADCAKRTAPVPRPSFSAVRPSPIPTPERSALNGTVISRNSGQHRVVAVMIDNYPTSARPQSGLTDADIVYEVEAEGGITRYMALFLEKTPRRIGPVRSARTYFVDLARPYDPLFAHAGENNDVWEPLKELRASGFADMDEIVGTPEAFWRDPSREMPHNLYTSVARLRSTARKYGWHDRPFGHRHFVFSSKSNSRRTAPDVILTFWNGYTVAFRANAGAYKRIINGQVQHDLENPTPYRVADIIAVWIPAKVLDDLGDLSMPVYGEFPAVLVSGGAATAARWVALGPNELPRLTDAKGASLALSPGQIYVEVLPQGGTLRNGKNIWSH